jgi:hypothetical protein
MEQPNPYFLKGPHNSACSHAEFKCSHAAINFLKEKLGSHESALEFLFPVLRHSILPQKPIL